ncbi:helix-turn-helix domain-containing protein [Alkalilacustris brevis]|uniref:helix-turn-helix domain-containing protein n=1 Tax=Alkalilacustris brevis TaxID=2026338 RepID=UPI000E0D47A3|nr:helix-turn-helix transcriptional regulator [Alkalilacustris brevis]
MSDESGPGWFSEEAATFGDRLAAAREAAGLSQSDLARRLGVRLNTVTSWENDISEPRSNKLQMVAGLLNVSLTWLLTGQGDGVEPPDESGALQADARGLVAEARQVRVEMSALTERLGRLEKRLRNLLREAAQ